MRQIHELDSCRLDIGKRITIRVASSVMDRERAWGLAYRVYKDMGYAKEDSIKLWYGLHDALPETTTLLANKEGMAIAALTLVFDSPLGLPADAIYPEELSALRVSGRHICEIVSLVAASERDSSERILIWNLCRLAYLETCRLAQGTDFVITVNPRHARYWESIWLFKRIGPERIYNKVNAAAVLLRLDLVNVKNLYQRKYGESNSLYRFLFIHPEKQTCLMDLLKNDRQSLSETELRLYFMELKQLLQEAPPEHRRYILACYPHLRLNPET